jgi:hypothetical protein
LSLWRGDDFERAVDCSGDHSSTKSGEDDLNTRGVAATFGIALQGEKSGNVAAKPVFVCLDAEPFALPANSQVDHPASHRFSYKKTECLLRVESATAEEPFGMAPYRCERIERPGLA